MKKWYNNNKELVLMMAIYLFFIFILVSEVWKALK